MANNNKKPPKDRKFNTAIGNLSNTIKDLSSSIYGTQNDDTIDIMNAQFQSILDYEITSLKGSGSNSTDDMTSFISKLYDKNKRENKLSEIFNNELTSMTLGSDDTTIGSFLTSVYQNKMIKQSDIHDIANQLIELKEAVNTMRDAIVTADIVDGRINREITFKGITDEETERYRSIIHTVEKRFEIQEKIKNFIVKEGLTYGEYYVYCIPYSAIFNDFMKNKSKYNTSSLYSYESAGDLKPIQEAMLEGNRSYVNLGCDDDESLSEFMESCYEDFEYDKNAYPQFSNEGEFHESFNEDLKDILSRVSVINADIPLPVMEEGVETVKEFRNEFVNESGDAFMETRKDLQPDDTFMKFMKDTKGQKRKDDSSEGIYSGTKKVDDFKDVKDCYIKMLEPTRVCEIKMMDEVIGYFYIKTDTMTPLNGVLSSTLYQTKFNQKRSEHDIVSDIAGRIIQKFDKKFLKENPKFKKLIVEALNFYDLSEQSVKFQFVPKEYMVAFKIDKDIDGNGTSMLEGSMFYAKLYLMLLLFKIMSIIVYSNDTKVNYIKQSGIDKNLINKVQQIAIQKQARTINIFDLFNYSTLINKIGNGNELFIPVGRSGDRPMETDILSGQEVQLNSELMELLRNSYILGTGVPAAILNYLNEADFAKSIEVANTKFNGRVVNYQLDFNVGIGELYRKILKYSTNIPEDVIDSIDVSLIQPKGGQNNIKSEAVGNITTIIDFITKLYFGESSSEEGDEIVIRKFSIRLAKLYLPMLNFEEIETELQKAKIDAEEEKLRPKDEPSTEDILGPM